LGIGVRAFIVSDDSVNRIPCAKLERMEHGDENETLPEYAGQRIRLAVAVVRMKDRRPMEIVGIDYHKVSIDQDGRLDQQERKEMLWDAMASVDFGAGRTASNVIDATSMFARKRFRTKYEWNPTQKERNRIHQLIFKRGLE